MGWGPRPRICRASSYSRQASPVAAARFTASAVRLACVLPLSEQWAFRILVDTVVRLWSGVSERAVLRSEQLADMATAALFELAVLTRAAGLVDLDAQIRMTIEKVSRFEVRKDRTEIPDDATP